MSKEKSIPQLTELAEKEREEAYERYKLVREHVEEGVSQSELARESGVPLKTLQRWVTRYKRDGLRGLARQPRSDRGKRRVPEELVKVVQGLALRKPRRTVATIHRMVCAIALEQGWEEPSYGQVRCIIEDVSPALLTLAHEGAETYREEYDLLYRREAKGPNEIWQADHCLLPIWVRDEAGPEGRPWLTVIEDDYSRAIMGYRLSWSAPSSIQTALVLRQAIWQKADPRWHVCGIPEVFYTDHGSDFTSVHMEQVGADLKMQLVFSQVSRPRGRGKIERFFRSVDQLFLEQQPGYAPKEKWPLGVGQESKGSRAGVLTLRELEEKFRKWLLEEYHNRVQKGQSKGPQARWEEGGYLPRMPEALEQLDLLLVMVARKRRVQQSGIAFEGHQYIDPALSGYVGEEIMVRYDPMDLGELKVYFRDKFVCTAICPELSGKTVSLKEIVAARTERRKELRGELAEREAVVKHYVNTKTRAKLAGTAAGEEPKETSPAPVEPVKGSEGKEAEVPEKKRLKRYINE